MYDPNEVQPVDSYVRGLLKEVVERFDLQIDLDNPTRGQRLEAALAMEDEANGFYSMEIMVGRRVDASEPLARQFGLLKISHVLTDEPNTRKLYEGFAHQYWSNEQTSEPSV